MSIVNEPKYKNGLLQAIREMKAIPDVNGMLKAKKQLLVDSFRQVAPEMEVNGPSLE